MKRSTWWLYLVSGLVGAVVLGSTIALAVRQGSWTPVEETGWLPAVLIAVLPGGRRRSCLPRRRGRAVS
jgi:hypothetical protein